MRTLVSIVAAAGLTLTVAAGTVAASGPPGIGFYAGGTLYRTVVTPTDFSGTGAPVGSFEPIYALGDGLTNVAAAAPGQPGFRGGRWMVLPVTWHVSPYQLYSGAAVLTAAQAGDLSIGTTPLREFECPVIPVPGNRL